MTEHRIERRGLIKAGLASLAALGLAGCGEDPPDWLARLLDGTNRLTETTQRALLGPRPLAPEYREADITPAFRANGSTDPDSPDYRAMAADGFAGWRLAVDGLVERPATFALADLRAMPARTQITRHDCVEGWSCIAKWTGVPLAHVLGLVGVKPEARYVLFRCADTMGEDTLSGPTPFYGSIGLDDAAHPQTILAYEMNGSPLPVRHGAPLRLRLEQALGYKMSKYIMRIELVSSFADIGLGRGGYWEDQGYDWYAGI